MIMKRARTLSLLNSFGRSCSIAFITAFRKLLWTSDGCINNNKKLNFNHSYLRHSVCGKPLT